MVNKSGSRADNKINMSTQPCNYIQLYKFLWLPSPVPFLNNLSTTRKGVCADTANSNRWVVTLESSHACFLWDVWISDKTLFWMFDIPYLLKSSIILGEIQRRLTNFYVNEDYLSKPTSTNCHLFYPQGVNWLHGKDNKNRGRDKGCSIRPQKKALLMYA